MRQSISCESTSSLPDSPTNAVSSEPKQKGNQASDSAVPSNVSDKYKQFIAEKKRRCHELASGYTPQKRLLEKIMISAFLALFFFSLFQILSAGLLASLNSDGIIKILGGFPGSGSPIASSSVVWFSIGFGFFMGMLSADLFSGVVHWFADTFCTKDTIILGPLIRSFREHHVDQQAITRHDVIESNGDNCMVGNVLLVACRVLCFSLWWKLPVLPGKQFLLFAASRTSTVPIEITLSSLFLLSWGTSFAFMFALTNQIHKWSHQYSVPFWVKWLQDCRIILHRKDHMIHHTNPFDRYYCITTGWLNPVLGATGFWRVLEFFVETLSGGEMKPRADDMAWTNHLSLLEETDIEDDSFFKQSSQATKKQSSASSTQSDVLLHNKQE